MTVCHVLVRGPLGDGRDRGLALEELFVEGVDIVAVRGDAAHAGDDDALLAVARKRRRGWIGSGGGCAG